MSGQKNSIEEKLKNIGLLNEAKIDKLNRLSAEALNTDFKKARRHALQAISLSQIVSYKLGEAYGYMNLGNTFLNQREFEEAGKAYVDSRKIFVKSKNANGLGLIYHKLGNLNYFLGNYKQSTKLYEISLKYKLQIGDEHAAAVLYSNLGVIYTFFNDYVAAVKSLYLGLAIFEKLEDDFWIGNIYINKGKIFRDLGDNEEAINAYNKALKINLKLNNQKTISEIRNNIGNTYFSLGEYRKAEFEHNQALKYRMSVNDSNNIAYSFSNLGDIFKEKRNFKKANNYYAEALSIFVKLQEKRGLALLYFNLGELKYLENDYQTSKQLLKEGLVLASSLGLKEVLKKSYEILSSIYSELKEFPLAYEFVMKMIRIDKEIAKSDKAKLIAQISMNAEIEKIGKEAEMEREKNEELTKAYSSLDLEKKKSEDLLLNILPVEVANELKQTGHAKAKLYEEVTIFFSDFVEFSKVSERLSPQELVDELHECFKAFDNIVSKYNIEKIKTIGDAYMAVAGLPIANKNHAMDIVNAAKEMLEFMTKRRKRMGEKTFKIRIGVNTGSAVAGIVGYKKFVYDIWGDAVNIAARMEQNSDPGCINISDTTYKQVKNKVECIYRGELEAKNKGKLKMYYVKL